MGDFGVKDDILTILFCGTFIYAFLVSILNGYIKKLFFKLFSLRKVKSSVTVDAVVADKYKLDTRKARVRSVTIEYDVIDERNPDSFKKLYLRVPNKMFNGINIGDKFSLNIITYIKGNKEVVEYDSNKIKMIGIYTLNSKYNSVIFGVLFIPTTILFILIILVDKYYNLFMY